MADKMAKIFLFSGEVMLDNRRMLKMNYVRGFLKAKKITQSDPFMLLEKIPRKNVVILRGKEDRYFLMKKL